MWRKDRDRLRPGATGKRSTELVAAETQDRERSARGPLLDRRALAASPALHPRYSEGSLGRWSTFRRGSFGAIGCTAFALPRRHSERKFRSWSWVLSLVRTLRFPLGIGPRPGPSRKGKGNPASRSAASLRRTSRKSSGLLRRSGAVGCEGRVVKRQSPSHAKREDSA